MQPDKQQQTGDSLKGTTQGIVMNTPCVLICPNSQFYSRLSELFRSFTAGFPASSGCKAVFHMTFRQNPSSPIPVTRPQNTSAVMGAQSKILQFHPGPMLSIPVVISSHVLTISNGYRLHTPPKRNQNWRVGSP
ncbi:hypothetical protein Pelo_16964 [Pelomyxa schiedti]|nr:hypothetical protein Pelo_16964 [Pelomyxa schiedti]